MTTNAAVAHAIQVAHTHPWLRKIRVAFVPGPMTPLLEEVSRGLERHFRQLGHEVQASPTDQTDAILTSARFGQPVGWRQALLFTAQRRFGLSRAPTVFTMVPARPAEFAQILNRFQVILTKEPPDPADYAFPGLAPQAYRTLFEQGHRGGPILALERLVQAQAKSIRVLLVVGEDQPLAAYHFDLVGAHPCSRAETPGAFYTDIVLRMVTALSTDEVDQHQVAEGLIPQGVWKGLSTPTAMCLAGKQLGERGFFSETVRVANLVAVPAVSQAVASQYSEGCFATWDPTLNALITTVTGSARPVDKGSITEDELAVIVGVRSDGRGALLQHVEGRRNDPPSVEAVEMIDMDAALPKVEFGPAWKPVPVVRSKLHGHRGIASHDPQRVEYVPLEQPYFHYLVSCGTQAQARAIKDAFSRAQALQRPEDPRLVIFTMLPGHGVMIVEKWVPGKAPFQVILEHMDAGYLVFDNHVPQGPIEYVPGPDGQMRLRNL